MRMRYLHHRSGGKKSVPARRLLPAIFLATYFTAAMTAGAKVIYVNGNLNTDPVPDGLTWATAFNTVQAGIDAAGDGDEIWVAAATYLENITLKSGVALYGGFAGTESNLMERDWTNRLTTLDGRQSNSVVIVQEEATNTTRIDGFTIQNGRATSGGGILSSNASPAILHNRIVRNVATLGGGGIECFGGAPEIAFNTVQGNVATAAGGGMECVDCPAVIHNNRIIGNNVNGANPVAGAGISCAGAGSPSIHDNLIVANWFTKTTVFQGGGGGIYSGNNNPSLIANNTLLWNQAPRGGGIYHLSVRAVIVNNIIAYGSSAVYSSINAVFSNNCFYANGTNDFSGEPSPVGTQGNISVDPQLVPNARYPDFHLSSTSPCRNAGDANTIQADWSDLDGEPRTVGISADIGADQFSDASHHFAPSTIRVSPAGDDRNDGSSWSSAKRSAQAAIDATSVEGGEVWVQSGTYHEQLILRLFVQLYGGFDGSETNRAQRDWKANLSVLDGGHQGSVITAQTLFNWNCVDGFLIQNGQAPAGGGIYCNRSSPVIANNIITNNAAASTNSSAITAGGAIYCAIGSPVVTNNVISFNQASKGGGIYCGPSSAPLVANNRIEGNIATTGRALTGSPPYGGGGIYVDVSGNASIVNNFFLNNIATNQADAFQPGSGGGICGVANTAPQILGNTFVGNLASSQLASYPENGGGICCDARRAAIINNLIAFGSSGIRSLSTNLSADLRNNCVYGNSTNYLVMSDVTGTSGNISVDPLLMATYDFHLGPGSPCIDAGDDTVLQPGWLDLDGQARRAGAHVDIGADEFGSSRPFTLKLLAAQSGGQSLLRLAGETGRTYVFEASSDLTAWTAFSTNLATDTTLEVPEPPGSPLNERFYRAFVPAP